ncbi:hypothetical protein [Algibacter sp. R77976]|uniref:hypothetical protein n=1 Tax=Algibacter sp. R77976 TaxID=3093873 RepID=UPI0037C9E72A
MLLTITLIIFSLVVINLFLLKFSCNKTIKTQKVDKKPIVLRTRIVISSAEQTLAPTGS